jgi:hypothetical protein
MQPNQSTADASVAAAAHLGLGQRMLALLRDGNVWNLRMPRTLPATLCAAVVDIRLGPPVLAGRGSAE